MKNTHDAFWRGTLTSWSDASGGTSGCCGTLTGYTRAVQAREE